MNITAQADAIKNYFATHRDEMITFLEELVLAESPSKQPETHARPLAIMSEALAELGYETTLHLAEECGGTLVATPADWTEEQPIQLLIGHCDTVWPVGTLETMPFVVKEESIHGPGVLDMKSGLTQMVFALRALRELGLKPAVAPVIIVNADEEVGSDESAPHIREWAQKAVRAFILEPAMGDEGKLKTARKGTGRYKINIHGQAAHAGLAPQDGVSAVLELSYVTQTLFDLTDFKSGVTVNVGVIKGGVQPNVIAPLVEAWVDARLPTAADAVRIDAAIKSLQPTLAGAKLEISGGINRPPMEYTAGNAALWGEAKALGATLGLELDHAKVGGASDGNTTSIFTPTLDGLGPVGAGAHAPHEMLWIRPWLERCGLLTMLLMTSAKS